MNNHCKTSKPLFQFLTTLFKLLIYITNLPNIFSQFISYRYDCEGNSSIPAHSWAILIPNANKPIDLTRDLQNRIPNN